MSDENFEYQESFDNIGENLTKLDNRIKALENKLEANLKARLPDADWKTVNENFIKITVQIAELRKDFYSHAKLIVELREVIDMQYSDPMTYKGKYTPTRFEKWQTKQMNKDYLLHKEWSVPQIHKLEEVLRELIEWIKKPQIGVSELDIKRQNIETFDKLLEKLDSKEKLKNKERR